MNKSRLVSCVKIEKPVYFTSIISQLHFNSLRSSNSLYYLEFERFFFMDASRSIHALHMKWNFPFCFHIVKYFFFPVDLIVHILKVLEWWLRNIFLTLTTFMF